MNAAALIANLLAALDLAQRGSTLAGELRKQYLEAKAAGLITAEQDTVVSAAYDELRSRGFQFE